MGLYPHKPPSFHASINRDKKRGMIYIINILHNIVPKKNKFDKLPLYVNYKMFCIDVIFKPVFYSQIIFAQGPATRFHLSVITLRFQTLCSCVWCSVYGSGILDSKHRC
jgi:hypothetical protein